MIQLNGFPRSHNVERVAIALAHKGLPTQVTLRGGDHRRLEAWLGRMAGHPQVPV